MILQGKGAFICGRHPKLPGVNGHYREYVMTEGRTTHIDKVTKKEIVEESLMCPRCYQTVPITPDLQIILDEYKNGRSGELTTINTRDILSSQGQKSLGQDAEGPKA